LDWYHFRLKGDYPDGKKQGPFRSETLCIGSGKKPVSVDQRQ
jgi:hypothetical protein